VGADNLHDLGDLDDAAAEDDAKAQPLGQRILEAVDVGDVKVVNERVVAFWADQGNGGLAEEPRDVVRHSSDLGPLAVSVARETHC
jgi:hypothetical protein